MLDTLKSLLFEIRAIRKELSGIREALEKQQPQVWYNTYPNTATTTTTGTLTIYPWTGGGQYSTYGG